MRADAAVARQGLRAARGARRGTVPRFKADLVTGLELRRARIQRASARRFPKIGGQRPRGALRAPLIDSEETPHPTALYQGLSVSQRPTPSRQIL